MKIFVSVIAFLIAVGQSFGQTMPTIAQQIDVLLQQGELSQAAHSYDQMARESDDEAERRANRWEAERLRRIVMDYDLDRTELLCQLKARIPNVNRHQFEEWLEEGRFDGRVIDGTLRFVSPSVSNLLFRYEDIRKRYPVELKQSLSGFLKQFAYAEANGDPTDDRLLDPQSTTIRMTVRVDADAVPAGKTIRCWMPYPQENEFQNDVQLLRAEPVPLHIAPSGAPHRSVYQENTAQNGLSTEFLLEYRYVSRSRLREIEPERVTTYIPDDVRVYLEEQEHVVFLPELRDMVQTIIGSESNPYRKAKAIYEWMADEFHYCYAREYSTIRNISEYSFEKRYGDCGQLALVYITLCRIAGIPARWESGWMLYPTLTNLHDWCVIYLEPYGWVPVDVNMGVEANHTWDSITPDEREAMHAFYFGKMDPYRLVANIDHSKEFDPPKQFPRSDTVDFQRGELETDDGNIYYNKFSYRLEILNREPVQP